MGVKTWMLVYSQGNPAERLKAGPVLDRAATAALVQRLFASGKIRTGEDGDLTDTCPRGGEIVAACFAGLAILAAEEFFIDRPSKLPARFVAALPDHDLYLLGMNSTVDWFAYAIWKGGKLQRSLSLAPDDGVIEEIGGRLPFEEPFWAGEHPAFEPGEEDEEYPFVFHPLELGEAARLSLFGYQLEGEMDAAHLQPETIALMRFKREKPWWRFAW